MLVVDAANVIGSRPNGWWRDRPGAARRLAEQLRASVREGRLDAPVVVVLEGQARRGVDEASVDGVEIVHASGEGDDTIVAVALAVAVAEAGSGVVVVTADRELSERVRAVDADALGPRWLLDQLGD
jgi:Mrp family chromosome partitioning ATPase